MRSALCLAARKAAATRAEREVFFWRTRRRKNDYNLFRVCGRLGSRWRLCRLTDAAYPLRVKLCEAFLTAALVGGGDVAGDALHDHVEGD